MGERIRSALALIILLLLLHPAGARDGEGIRVIPAQEILDKIERGEPVAYDHVVVEGDLDLGKLELPKRDVKRTEFKKFIGLSENSTLVLSPIRINDSTINGSISFSNMIFRNPVDFKGSCFNDDVDFVDSDFDGEANFRNSTFNGTTYFWGSDFNGYVDFVDSDFNGEANFRNSTFNGIAYFWGLDFNGDAYFVDSDFNGDAYFVDSDFNGDAYFVDSDFNGDAYFYGSAFNGYANFEDSTFKVYADFVGSYFKSYANFIGSAFNGEAYFWGSDFNGEAYFLRSSFNISDFSVAEFNKPVSFFDANFSNSTSFNDSRFKEDAIFEGAIFDGPLYLTRTKYDRLYIRWNSMRELGYNNSAYLSLLENFKKLGYAEDYDACYYEYRRLHRDQSWSGKYHALHPWEEWLRKRIDLGLDAFYGYGKKPILPLIWSAATTLLFGLLWRRAGVDGRRGKGQGIYERYGLRGKESRKTSWEEELRALFGAMLFSATLFLSGTRLFVDPPALPVLQGWFASHAHSFFIAERVLGAFFSILFFLAISGTVVR